VVPYPEDVSEWPQVRYWQGSSLESRFVAIQPARSFKPAARLQQNTDHRKCCVRVERRTSVNRMTEDGADGCRRRADNQSSAKYDGDWTIKHWKRRAADLIRISGILRIYHALTVKRLL